MKESLYEKTSRKRSPPLRDYLQKFLGVRFAKGRIACRAKRSSVWKASQNPTFEISRKGPPLVSDCDHSLDQWVYNFPQPVSVIKADREKLCENRAGVRRVRGDGKVEPVSIAFNTL